MLQPWSGAATVTGATSPGAAPLLGRRSCQAGTTASEGPRGCRRAEPRLPALSGGLSAPRHLPRAEGLWLSTCFLRGMTATLILVVPVTSASGLSCWGRLLHQAVSSASPAGAPARGGIGPEACVPGQAGSTMPPGRPRLALCPLSRQRPPRSLPPREDSVPPS